VRLFVKRVFVLDNVDEVLPPWLRFMRGVVDSDDLPLNVSREMLQESAALRSIKKQLTKKSLDLLEEMAKDRTEDYATFWSTFGTVVKEGIATDGEHRERLAGLARFATTHESGTTTLAEYVSRMPEKQKDIYYLFGESRAALAGSPYLESLGVHGFEVLLMTDPIDEWVTSRLTEFSGKKLVSAMRAELTLATTDEEKREKERLSTALAPLVRRIEKVLGARVKSVAVSSRLTESPACLVLPSGAAPALIERLLKERGTEVPHEKRVLEINPTHPLVQKLNALAEQDKDEGRLEEWIEVLYEQTLLVEGSSLEDPNRFARRVAQLLTEVAAKAT
jgi:molecular chaperone HtpG